MDELTPEEKKLLGFAIACYLEDLDKRLRNIPRHLLSWQQRNKIEKILYTKLIPESWKGPKPTYWED